MGGVADIGCLADYSYFGKFWFALLVVPVLFGVTFAVYCFFVRKDKMVDGSERERLHQEHNDRCFKMFLTGLFLSKWMGGALRPPRSVVMPAKDLKPPPDPTQATRSSRKRSEAVGAVHLSPQ